MGTPIQNIFFLSKSTHPNMHANSVNVPTVYSPAVIHIFFYNVYTVTSPKKVFLFKDVYLTFICLGLINKAQNEQ
jgi:hypothetical protein